jgi:hypothetical protein
MFTTPQATSRACADSCRACPVGPVAGVVAARGSCRCVPFQGAHQPLGRFVTTKFMIGFSFAIIERRWLRGKRATLPFASRPVELSNSAFESAPGFCAIGELDLGAGTGLFAVRLDDQPAPLQSNP